MGGVWAAGRDFGLHIDRRRNRLVLGWFAGVKALLVGLRFANPTYMAFMPFRVNPTVSTWLKKRLNYNRHNASNQDSHQPIKQRKLPVYAFKADFQCLGKLL